MVDHFYEGIQGFFADGAKTLYTRAVERASSIMPSNFVEIGVWRGRSTAFLAVEVKNSGKPIRLHAIDTFVGDAPLIQMFGEEVHYVYDEWCDNIRRPELPFVELTVGESAPAAAEWPDRSVDFLFIDGDHQFEGFLADVNAWFPKMKSTGIMAGDDFNFPAVNAIVRSKFPNIETDGRVWVRRNYEESILS